MDRSDVSFTFLDRIREIEENIEDGRFQSAQPGHRAAVFPVGGYIRGPVPKKGPG